MSLPGWYYDPANQPGRFRYWDGTSWSQVTTADPGDPPPAPSGVPRIPRRRRTALIAAAATVVLLVIVAVAVARHLGNRTDETDPYPRTSPSTIESSATQTPTPSPTPSPLDTPTPVGPQPSAGPPSAGPPCPIGNPAERQPHPTDDRVHGGGLSFPAQSGWQPSDRVYDLTWAYDVAGQEKVRPVGRSPILAVGALSTIDGFESPEQAADAVVRCAATSTFYPGFAERRDVTTEPLVVAGYPAFHIRRDSRTHRPHHLAG